MTVRVQFTIRKRGGRKLAIAADGTNLTPPRPRVDNTLVKALARAHRSNRLLESSRYDSAAELAAAETVNPSSVSRVLRLALLAPDIVEAIVEGRQAGGSEAAVLLLSCHSRSLRAFTQKSRRAKQPGFAIGSKRGKTASRPS